MIANPKCKGGGYTTYICSASLPDSEGIFKSLCLAAVRVIRSRRAGDASYFYVLPSSVFHHDPDCAVIKPKALPRGLQHPRLLQSFVLSSSNATGKDMQSFMEANQIKDEQHALRRARHLIFKSTRIPYDKMFEYMQTYCELFSASEGNG